MFIFSSSSTLSRILCRGHSLSCRNISHKLSVRDILTSDSIENKELHLKGWVRAVRIYKKVAFIGLSDGSSQDQVQIVTSPDEIPRNLTYGSCIEVDGSLKASRGKEQKYDVIPHRMDVIGACDPLEYPIIPGQTHSAEYLRQIPHLRARTNFFSALTRTRNTASIAMHQCFQNEDFLQVHTPIITTNDCEGGCELFRVEPASESKVHESETDASGSDEEYSENPHFFGTPAHLTVSAQLHLEVMSGAFPRVYSFGPTFRAENTVGRHHLSEFYMVEGEMAFVKSLEDIMIFIEHLVKNTTEAVLEKNGEDVEWFHEKVAPEHQKRFVQNLANNRYTRMSYSEAIKILEKTNTEFKFPVKWGDDLKKEHEKFLVSHCEDTPVFVTDFPKDIKAFYARINDDDKTVGAVDLLCPGVGELVGGSLREERLYRLSQSLHDMASPGNYDWYLDLRRFGSCPHGGFGLGFERYLQALLGIPNIRDTILFPRWARSCRL